MFNDLIEFIHNLYKTNGFIPLHEPKFIGNEKKYLQECIDSTFVSSVGKFVQSFEDKISKYLGVEYAIATVNGTSALHIALILANVKANDEVITQPLSFVATCNAINYCGATPIFVDVDKDTIGLSAKSLEKFLSTKTSVINKKCINNKTKKIIKACVPMHTFGHPCRIDKIKEICDKYYITLVEDAAESLGSKYLGKPTGTYGEMGIFSFNGNKIITSGGGGCLVTNNKDLAQKAKHLTTTAKLNHKWEFNHDEVGYNYRMPNLNAAILVAQFENLDRILLNKRELASLYEGFFRNKTYSFIEEPKGAYSNYWLNSLVMNNKIQRDLFLDETNSNNIMTRPIWKMLNKLPMYKTSQSFELENSEWLEDRVINIPSSPLSL
jgi:perosamine synthetase